MKKLLALVLALVMTLGLATVSTSAAYSDANDIDYSEAVDVMTAVGVFQGKGNAFAPKDGLNRAEAAKLIAYLMLGNKTAEAMKGSGTRFTDVPASHWAAGYIEYLASVGVVSGVGGGQFNPNGQVTAVQFAKMLLVALGYDAELENFVGDGWSINIQKVANENDLFDALDLSANDALTREQAAQMCLNDLKADMVEYADKGTTVKIGESTVVTGAKKADKKTTSNDKGKAIDADKDGAAYILNLGEDLYNGDLKLDDTGADDFGRPSNKWTYKNEDVGTYDSSADLLKTYTAKLTKGALYDLLGKSVYDNLVSTSNAATLTVYEDGYQVASIASGEAAVKAYADRNNGDKIANDSKTGNGTLTQVYKDDDDNVTVVIINTYVYQASSDYRTSSETLIIETPSDATKSVALESYTLDLDDFEQIKDYKEDDYLLITAYHTTATGVYTVDSVKKAELLTGNVDKVVVEDTVTINGDVKKYSNMASNATKASQYSVGHDATLVLDTYGYVIYVDEAVVSTNYVFIADIGSTSSINSKVVADAYFTDGTNQEITIKELKGSSNKNAMVATSGATKVDAAAGGHILFGAGANTDTGVVDGGKLKAGWYTYSKNSAGEYSLYDIGANHRQAVEYAGKGAVALENVVTSDKVAFIKSGDGTTGTKALNNDYFTESDDIAAGTVLANDKTIFIVTNDDDDVDVYTGVKNIPDINLLAETSTGSNDGGRVVIFSVIGSTSLYADYVFVSLSGNNTVYGSEAEELLYLVKYDKEHKIDDNDNYFTYKALDENAKEITIEAEKILDGHNNANKNIYAAYNKTSKNSDGQYTRATAVGAGSGKYYGTTSGSAAIKASNGTINIDGKNFTLASDYKLVVVTMKAANALNKDKGADYEANIMTASGLEALTKGYSITYDLQVRTKDDYKSSGANELVEAYVTIKNVTDASAKGITGATLTVEGGSAQNVTLYDKIADAAAAPVTVEMEKTLTVAATGTNISKKMSADITTVPTNSTTVDTTYANTKITSAANTTYRVEKITSTAADNSTVDKYFVIKAVPATTAVVNSISIDGVAVSAFYTTQADAEKAENVITKPYVATGDYVITASVTDKDNTAAITKADDTALTDGKIAKGTAGTTTVKVTAEAEDGTKAYGYIAVKVAKSTDATLASVKFNGQDVATAASAGAAVVVNQDFNNAGGNYTLVATATDAKATVAFEGLSGTATTNSYSANIAKDTASNNPVKITVTAEDGNTEADYYVKVAVVKTIALDSTALPNANTFKITSSTNDSYNGSSVTTHNGSVTVGAVTLTQASTCAASDITGTVILKLMKANNPLDPTGAYTLVATKNATVTNAASAATTFDGLAAGIYKISYNAYLDGIATTYTGENTAPSAVTLTDAQP